MNPTETQHVSHILSDLLNSRQQVPFSESCQKQFAFCLIIKQKLLRPLTFGVVFIFWGE